MKKPVILERANSHLMGIDITSKLMQERIIMLDEEITSEFASEVITQLLYLKSVSKDPITIFVNGPGGDIYAGLGIYDMMQSVKNSGIIVRTRGIGFACSMQSLLLTTGTKGERKVYPSTTIMIHQPTSWTKGTVTDMEIDYKESSRLKEKLYNLYIENGASSEIKELMERDYWMDAKKAIELGLIDEIL